MVGFQSQGKPFCACAQNGLADYVPNSYRRFLPSLLHLQSSSIGNNPIEPGGPSPARIQGRTQCPFARSSQNCREAELLFPFSYSSHSLPRGTQRSTKFFCHREHREFLFHRGAAVFEIKGFFRFFRDAIRSDSAS